MQDATRAQLCLTRLCELTAPQLLLQLWPVVLRIGAIAQDWWTPEGLPRILSGDHYAREIEGASSVLQ